MSEITLNAQWVTIANRALIIINNQTISSLDDGSASANYSRELIPAAIDAVYSAFPWRESLRRASLAPLADAPAFGFTYAFMLPADFARLKEIAVDGEWVIEGRVVHTNATSVNIVYSAMPSNPSEIGVVLRDLLVKQLACLLSLPLTANESTTSRIAQQYEKALAIAIQQDRRDVYEENSISEWYDNNR